MVKLVSKVIDGVIYIHKDGCDTSSCTEKITLELDEFIEGHVQRIIDSGKAKTVDEAVALIFKSAIEEVVP